MAVRVEYEGELHCKAVHEASGAVISTDAPKDHHGRGEGFSPSDLLSAALGSCILSMMGIAARSLEIDISGAKVSIDKKMGGIPRAIVQINATVEMLNRFGKQHEEVLEKAAHSCPVHNALDPNIEAAIRFTWPDQ